MHNRYNTILLTRQNLFRNGFFTKEMVPIRNVKMSLPRDQLCGAYTLHHKVFTFLIEPTMKSFSNIKNIMWKRNTGPYLMNSTKGYKY